MSTACYTIRMPTCCQAQRSGSPEPSASQPSPRSAKDERRFSSQTTEGEWESMRRNEIHHKKSAHAMVWFGPVPVPALLHHHHHYQDWSRCPPGIAAPEWLF